MRERAARLVDDGATPHTHGLRWSLAFDRLLADGAERRGPDWVGVVRRACWRPPSTRRPTATCSTRCAPRTARRRRRAPATAPLASAAGRRALAQAIGAAALATQGRWSDAEPEFDAALAALRKLTGKRRGLVPLSVALPNVLALLAQQTPAHLDKALKFCLTEGGKREPVLDHPLGAIALAIQMRLGAAPRDTEAVPAVRQPVGLSRRRVARGLAAGSQPLADARLAQGRLARRRPAADRGRLGAATSRAPTRAPASTRWPSNWAPRCACWAASPRRRGSSCPRGWSAGRWRSRRCARSASPAAAPGAAAGAPDTRVVWLIETGDNGAIRGLVPHEQKRGVRGWGQLKEVPLSRLQRGAQTLTPADAGVVRAIRQETFGRGLRLDLAQAVGALFGHPHVAFSDAPGQFIELVEAGPELEVGGAEVVDEGERLRVRMQPALQVANDAAVARWAGSEAEQKELDALRLVSIWRDGPQRAQADPPDGLAEARRAAAGPGRPGHPAPGRRAAAGGAHRPGQPLPHPCRRRRERRRRRARSRAESRLRAELQPVGDGLQLRLVAAPFGADYAAVGPRLIPGRGRARVVATLKGESVGVQRDLELERQHLESVLDTCPMLRRAAAGRALRMAARHRRRRARAGRAPAAAHVHPRARLAAGPAGARRRRARSTSSRSRCARTRTGSRSTASSRSTRSWWSACSS